MKEKIYKLDFIKIENFFSLKDMVKTIRKYIAEWEKIYANHIS